MLDGKIHLLGGRDVRSVEWHEIYDPATDKYTFLAGMRGSTGTQPFVGQRDHMGVAVVDGKIHAIAGRMDSYDFNTSLNAVYDPKTDGWSFRAPLPTRAADQVACTSKARSSCSAVKRRAECSARMKFTIRRPTPGKPARRCRSLATACMVRPALSSATWCMCQAAGPSRAAVCKAPITTHSCLNKLPPSDLPVPTIFLTHTPDMLANYYGARALAALRALAPVRVNETRAVLDAATLGRRQRAARSSCRTGRPRRLPSSSHRCRTSSRSSAWRSTSATSTFTPASAHGVLVTHATPGFVASVAEMAVGYMIDCARHITAATIDYRAGHAPEARMGRQLKGATLGIIGYGAIGEYLAQLGLAFGMAVLITDPKKTVATEQITQVPLPDLLARSDYVVCLAVATEETENLMDADAFARMRKDAFFLNLSRGNLVDENALAAALDARRNRRCRHGRWPRAGPEAIAGACRPCGRDRNAAYGGPDP